MTFFLLQKPWLSSRTGWLAITFLSALTGCTSYTHDRMLDAGEIDSSTVDSGYFQHRLFQPAASVPENTDKHLHIYLGGDGRPWRTSREVAWDPTSERGIMLENMLRGDPASVYIGRPCYFQTADTRCQGNWWTHDRYHPEVVDSLLNVVEQLATDRQELWLIGHSGGGALAVLLGRRLNRPVNVVTVNANLDHQAWTEHHQYSPLTGSLNPMNDEAHNPDMRELHWYASEDQTVLPEWILAYCQKHQTPCLPVSGGHSSGWPEQWPMMLRCIDDFFAQQESSARANQRTPTPGEACESLAPARSTPRSHSSPDSVADPHQSP